MAQENVKETVNTAAEETQATETKTEQQNAAPEAKQEETGTQEKEKKEHPVLDKIKTGAGKVWNFTKKAAPIAGAVVVGVFAGKALGKAEGYEKAIDRMNPTSPEPVPELPCNDIGADDIVDVDFGDVTVADPVPVDTPAE